MTPALALTGLTAVHNGAAESVDISTRAGLRRVQSANDVLSRKLVLGDTDLARGNEVVGRLTAARGGNRGARNIGGECSESLENDVLVWWPSVWCIPGCALVMLHMMVMGTCSPLETSLDERHRHGTVVAVENHVKSREEAEGVLRRCENFVGNDAVPEWVEGRRGEDAVARVGSRVKVVECELRRIPEEVEDGFTQGRSCLCVVGGGSAVVQSGVEVGEDEVRPVYTRSERGFSTCRA